MNIWEMRMKYLLNIVCFDTGSMYVADILCWHWGPPWPLRLYEQLHCFAINNSWPLPIARRKIFSTLIFPKIGFLQCSNISKIFSPTDLGRDILLFSTPFPRMSYGNNLPLLLSNMRKTHKINCAKGFERMKSNNSDVDYCSKYLEHDEFNYDCSVNRKIHNFCESLVITADHTFSFQAAKLRVSKELRNVTQLHVVCLTR